MVTNSKASKGFYLLLCIPLFFAALMSSLLMPFSAKHALAAGTLIVPTDGTITQYFLDQTYPDEKGGSYYDQNDQLHSLPKNSKFVWHDGVDIAAPNGTDCTKQQGPVSAAGAGTVIFAGYQAGFGWSVEIDHGQSVSSNGKYVFTLYGHMGTADVKNKPGTSCLAVTNGQKVTAGQLIGYQGQSGNATGVHLHWSVKVNPTADTWKGSIYASPDFYSCQALTIGDSSLLSSVTTGQSCAAPPNYFDDFSSYTPGQPPTGYLLRGASGATPTVQEVGGTGPAYRLLSFPYVGGQYWDSWALKDGLTLQAPYVVTAKLNFQTSGDRGGLTIAWNDTNWDRIDIQPNIYWQDVEFRITYTGPIPSSPVVTGAALTPGGLPMQVGTDYWLQVAATSNGPGQGQVIVSWSTDGTNFTPIVTATGLADLTGLAGMGTAGPNLPNVYFDDFQIT